MTFLIQLAILILTLPIASQGGTLTLPAGAQLTVVMETSLTTKKTKVGDPFRARLVVPVFANQREVLPVGTSIEGTVVNLKGPGRVKGKAQMQLRPDMLYLPDGRDIALGAELKSAQSEDGQVKLDPKEGTIQGGGKKGMDAKKTIGGVGLGAGIGGIAGGGTGAAIGAGAAGTVAILHQVFKRGKDADLPAGSELVLEVTRDVSFSDMQEVPQKPKIPLVK